MKDIETESQNILLGMHSSQRMKSETLRSHAKPKQKD